jgi:head-tail adaptor
MSSMCLWSVTRGKSMEMQLRELVDTSKGPVIEATDDCFQVWADADSVKLESRGQHDGY